MSKKTDQKKKKGIWSLYKLEGGKVKMSNKKCPRCGKVMAFHKEPKSRWTCGGCQYTEYVKR
ncbi:MAG: 30S ribosomal protein S27ae [Thermoproteota archaeon]